MPGGKVMDSDEKQTAVFPLNGREREGQSSLLLLIEAGRSG